MNFQSLFNWNSNKWLHLEPTQAWKTWLIDWFRFLSHQITYSFTDAHKRHLMKPWLILQTVSPPNQHRRPDRVFVQSFASFRHIPLYWLHDAPNVTYPVERQDHPRVESVSRLNWHTKAAPNTPLPRAESQLCTCTYMDFNTGRRMKTAHLNHQIKNQHRMSQSDFLLISLVFMLSVWENSDFDCKLIRPSLNLTGSQEHKSPEKLFPIHQIYWALTFWRVLKK